MIEKSSKRYKLFSLGLPSKLKLLKKPPYGINAGDNLYCEVQVLDAFDNMIETDDIEIIVSIEGHNILEGESVVKTSNGIAKFDNLFVSKVIFCFWIFGFEFWFILLSKLKTADLPSGPLTLVWKVKNNDLVQKQIQEAFFYNCRLHNNQFNLFF